jgi:hypothetical protein
MTGLINIGGGLSAMGQSLSDSSMFAMKNELDNQKLVLANQLQEGSQTRLENLRQSGALAQTAAQGEQERLTAPVTAEAQGSQQRQTAQYETTLPMTAAQKAQTDASMLSAKASMAEADRPVPSGFSMGFMARDPKTGVWGIKTIGDNGALGGADGGDVPPLDPNSNNLSSQIGLSENAIRVATGQLGGRYATLYTPQLQAWGEKSGRNIDTLMPQAKAAFNVLQQNIQRNNQGTILENEIQGSVSNLSPMLDAAKRGDIRFANSAEGWVAQQANNPQATQIADQINRFRGEVAGYNAVASGHLMQNGTPDPHPDDYKSADALISNGVNSGSVKALSQSVAMSAAKNRGVLLNSIDDANKNFYGLFGAKYHTTPTAPASAESAPPAGNAASGRIPSGWTLHQDANGNRAYVSPDGKQYIEAK